MQMCYLAPTIYAVSRTHFGQHTETQLLYHLPTLLNNCRTAFGADLSVAECEVAIMSQPAVFKAIQLSTLQFVTNEDLRGRNVLHIDSIATCLLDTDHLFTCLEAIDGARYNGFCNGQFVVAYLTNMVNEYMNPTLNCQNRDTLQRYVFWPSGLQVKEGN